MRLTRSVALGAALVGLATLSSCSTRTAQHISTTGNGVATVDSQAGVNGSHAWRIRSGQLQVSGDGGNSWSDDGLPTGLTPGSVAAGQVSPSGQLVLSQLGATTVTVFCQAAPSADWITSAVTPKWVAGYNISGAPGDVVVDFDPSGNAHLVMQRSIGSTTSLISTFESPAGGCSFNPVFSASTLRWDTEVFGSSESGVALVGPAERALEFTTNGGKSWSDSVLPDGIVGDSFSAPAWNGSLFVDLASASDPSGSVTLSVLTSTDGSRFDLTGSQLSVPDSQNPVAFTVLAEGNTLWTFGKSHEVLESSDLGRTWKSVQDPSVPVGVDGGSIVSPSTATVVTTGSTCSTVSCSTTTSSWVTVNGGSSWTPQ